ncbi:MAG: gliding motility-associated C-terminal domain-containing protein [Crocinitomicaceae bacterium]
MSVRSIILTFLLFTTYNVVAQGNIWIKPNKGQWHQNVEYLIKVPSGELFLEKSGFTYQYHNAGEILDKHNHKDGHDHDDKVKSFSKHVVKTEFLDANPAVSFNEIGPSSHVENYLIGNDSTKWVKNLRLFNEVNYVELYNGINLNLYESDQTLKYDIIVKSNADVSQYRVKYTGQESIEIVEGAIVITTSLGTITESKPYAYQIINGIKREITCDYVLENKTVSFNFPEDYDTDLPLVIDPVLLFSTFTGSTSDNWGMTACPDLDDKLIAAGIVFGGGYPTAGGLSNNTFNGGQVDIGLTKFNANGSALEFSTYIGGSGSETPHSVIVNDINQIFLMGATSSSNFPIPANGYQTTFLGGSPLINGFPNTSVDGINFNAGSDLYVIKLNPNGSSILNGTFIGGSENDGISNAGNSVAGDDIAFNYGDLLRGEIIVGPNSTVYISSTTRSSDFPVVGGFQTSLSGAQDAVFIKLNNTLSNIMYSSYVGGSGLESGNSIQLSSIGDLFMTGGTTSGNFPFTAGQLNASFLGGTTDGYVIKLEGPNYANPKASYIGTSGYDQSYFVQLDLDDKVYLYGQTNGNYPITAGIYNNNNSGQFIHKLDNNLTSTEWSSVFGASTGNVEISPTAFLVSDCYEIYVAGWGGVTNTANAVGSTSAGFPLTPDAFQNTTSGNNFWLGLFESDMVGLKYATFMGNTNQSGQQGDHVDGGTSRFSKGGKIFHAVCAACQGLDNGFPTTPGAYSETNSSSNCNMAGFVFDLSKIEAVLGTPLPITCLPNATIFNNTSVNGNTFQWFFGDGDSIIAFSPTHLYPGPGIYNVMLVVSDSNGCYTPDTAYTQVEIIQPIYEAYAFEDTICPGTQVQLQATGGTTFLWSPPGLFNDPNLQSPIGTISSDTSISVDITGQCGTTTLNVDVWTYDVITGAGGDTTICRVTPSSPDFAAIFASGGGTYNWTPGLTLDDSTSSSPLASPNNSTGYEVIVTTPDGCLDTNFVLVQVDEGLPVPVLPPAKSICLGNSAQIIASGANSYNWTPNYNISALNVYNPTVWPEVDTTYSISFTNSCGTNFSSIFIQVNDVEPIIRPDTTVCPNEPVALWADGGVTYTWKPTYKVANPNSAVTVASPSKTTWYTVKVSDEIGCSDTTGFRITVFDKPRLEVSSDVYAVQGDLVPIWAIGDGNVEWFPKSFINCTTCKETEVFPPRNDKYIAVLTDNNGCTTSDEVAIFYSPLIYVPNAFTPDGNEFNNVFKAVTHNIEEFEMIIYNRWGEVVFITYDPEGAWDGYYAGQLAQDGLYVWKIHYTDLNDERQLLVGHVSLLR